LRADIDVIVGPMFAGKTEEIIREYRRANVAGLTVEVLKPYIDNRYKEDQVVSHNKTIIEAVPVADSRHVLEKVMPDVDLLILDEVQFFDSNIVNVVQQIADRGTRVVCAGLDLDFRAEPFGCVGSLLCKATNVLKLTAICTICNAPATRSQRLINGKPAKYGDPIVVVGADESYQARCRSHYELPG
jgi:thymidine kinase